MKRVAFIALLLLGCGGGGGNLDVCNAQCDANGKCGMLPQASTQMCHDNCGAMAPQFHQQDIAENNACTNAGDIRAKKIACYEGDCSQIQTCLSQVPLCMGTH